jgi:hypothetical protein
MQFAIGIANSFLEAAVFDSHSFIGETGCC